MLIHIWDCNLIMKNAALAMRFTRKKSSIERLDIAQFGSYYVRTVGLLFIDSCKDLGISVDTELQFDGHIRSIVGKRSGTSVEVVFGIILVPQNDAKYYVET